MSKIVRVNDSVNMKLDEIKHGGIWADTEIVYGHGYHRGDRFHKSYLDEEIGFTKNIVPVSGVQAIFEMMFGTKGPINIQTLYTKHGIGVADENTAPTYLNPYNESIEGKATNKTAVYQLGNLVQLFGIGITGTAENNITVHKCGYRECYIEETINTADGQIDAIMLPFRYTESELDPNERQKYFGKRKDAQTGKTGYYLKKFAGDPEIKHVWRSSDEVGSKITEVVATNDTIWDFSRDDALKSLIEIHFTLDALDVKEYFTYKLDQPEAARFNTIALFMGKYTEAGKETAAQFGDYCNVRLYSKLNIQTEPMSLEKDLEFIYRIYGS